jgi:hypothetical protein
MNDQAVQTLANLLWLSGRVEREHSPGWSGDGEEVARVQGGETPQRTTFFFLSFVDNLGKGTVCGVRRSVESLRAKGLG